MTDNILQAPQSELLLFQRKDGKARVECRFESDSLWPSQAIMCDLYGKAKATISEHISNILAESELDTDSVVRIYRTTAAGGNTSNVKYYSLPMGDLTIRIVRQEGSITKQAADNKAKQVYDQYAQNRRLIEIEGAKSNIDALSAIAKERK